MKRLLTLLFAVLWLTFAANARELCVIVNKNNPVNGLSLNDLRRMYLSMKLKWSDGKKIVATIYPSGTPERTLFITSVIGMKPEEFLVYYDNEKMKGTKVAKPIVLNSDFAIQCFVQKNPDAIGFVNFASLDSTAVKALSIDGFAPGEKKYPLRKK
jgi:ABC-type phosphate transport system substrate-binding protein